MRAKSGIRLSGFTLTETLVVLSIISVLSLMLLPILASVKERTRTVTCASSMTQIGLSMRQYATDYNGHIPSSAAPPGNCSWLKQLEPYVSTTSIFVCPSDNNNFYRSDCPPVSDPELSPHMYKGSYAINYLRIYNRDPHLRSFTHPGSTIVVVDAARGTLVNPAENGPLNGPKDLVRNGVSDRHSGGANVLFADYHTKWLSLKKLTDQNLWLLSASE